MCSRRSTVRPKSWLSYPSKLSIDKTKKRLFITDSNHDRIIITNPSGEILDIIGSGQAGKKDGTFADCQFFRPQGLVYDEVSDILYIADTENHLLRFVSSIFFAFCNNNSLISATFQYDFFNFNIELFLIHLHLLFFS